MGVPPCRCRATAAGWLVVLLTTMEAERPVDMCVSTIVTLCDNRDIVRLFDLDVFLVRSSVHYTLHIHCELLQQYLTLGFDIRLCPTLHLIRLHNIQINCNYTTSQKK